MTSFDPLSELLKVKTVSRETYDRLTVFHNLLYQWQKRINLIAPSTINEIWQRHILDSVHICTVAGPVDSVIDIGSGAGFPGLVQAILFAERGNGTVELIESSGKKCAFLNAVVRDTKIREAGVSVKVHNGRIENILPNLERPDVVSARALASLDDLLRLTESCLSQGVVGLFPKGREHLSEIEQAQKNWNFESHITDSPYSTGSVVIKIADLKPL